MTNLLNPDAFYKEVLDDWSTIWDADKSLYDNVFDIVSSSVFLPRADIFLPLICTYILMPAKWARVAGILFCTGDEGSGKSTIATIANLLHGFEHTFSPTDTFASIRNNLDAMRWFDLESKDMEREGAILCWDNISIETLQRDPKIYQLLLFGYNRKTDRISIAQPDGTNKEYFVFCPKILSSIEPIHLVSLFSELRRRLFVVVHKKFSRFTADELLPYEGKAPLEIESICWDGIEEEFYKFWEDATNCKQYAFYRSLLSKSKKSFTIPKVISSEKWTITIDLIATGLTLGCWSDLQEAIDYFAMYWEYSDMFIYGEWNASMEHLKEFINDETETLFKINENIAKTGGKPIDVVIESKKLASKIQQLRAEAKLDVDISQYRNLEPIMQTLGWKLTKKGWVQR